jgi:diacylglycerol kinase family enzyme
MEFMREMGGIGIITNPNSKLNKKMPARGRLLGYIVGQFGNLEITNSVEDIGRVAVLFKEQAIETLAINGGDGTISRTLTAFIRAYGSTPLPQVLVLRGGTINMLADNLGIRGTPEEILVRMLESQSGLRSKEIRALATLSVGGQFGFLFGNGLIARFLSEFYKKKTGPIGSLFLVLKIYMQWIFSPHRYSKMVFSESYRAVFGGQVPHSSFHSLAMMASTVERAPLGLKIFPEVAKTISEFQFFSLEMPARSLPWRLPLSIVRNRSGNFFGKVSRMASHLVLTAEAGRQIYTIDGELFEAPAGRLAVGLGPVVQFVVV